jgi:ATP-dependent DNA helicase RecQ
MYGVGQQKLKKYADEFLPIIQAYCREHRITEKEKPVVSRPVSSGGDRITAVATLYNNGHTIADIAAQFGVKPRTVIGHLWKAAQTGVALRPDGFLAASQLPPETQQRVIAAFAELGTGFLRPVYEALDGAVDWDELHLLRLYVVSKGEM